VSGVRARAVGRAGGDDGGGGGGDARIELMTKPSPESFQWMYSLQASSCRMFHSVSSQTVILAGGERRRRAAEEARVPARVAGERRGEETEGL